MNQLLPEPLSDFRELVVEARSPSKEGWVTAKIVGANLEKGALEVEYEGQVELIPACVANFIFHQKVKGKGNLTVVLPK